jgi:hypothetical protein
MTAEIVTVIRKTLDVWVDRPRFFQDRFRRFGSCFVRAVTRLPGKMVGKGGLVRNFIPADKDRRNERYRLPRDKCPFVSL